MKKYITLLLLMMLLGVTCAVPVSAAEDVAVDVVSVQNADGSVQPYADVIVTKYRYYQGKRQYRHWNETRGYWAEPDWITYA